MNEERTILGFFGTRYFDGDGFYDLIAQEVAKHKPEYIVTSGETEGISMLARRYARKEGIPLKLHFLNRAHGRGQFNERSRAIAGEATHLIIIHDGQSTGTANELALIKKLKKPYTYHVIKPEVTEEGKGYLARINRGENIIELAKPLTEGSSD